MPSMVVGNFDTVLLLSTVGPFVGLYQRQVMPQLDNILHAPWFETAWSFPSHFGLEAIGTAFTVFPHVISLLVAEIL